jgi:hypothetical protein
MRTGDQRAERAQAKPERVRRGRGDTGAIIAEAALITPFFMFILFGILEFGGTFRDYLTLNNAVATASRKASVAANAPDADYGVVLTIRKEIGAMPLSQVQRIIIFHASGPNSAAPKTCLSGATGSAGSGSPLWTGRPPPPRTDPGARRIASMPRRAPSVPQTSLASTSRSSTSTTPECSEVTGR